MRMLSLFSGVGALDAAVCAAFGATVVAHCEADAYCRRVLARHWPGVPCFDDVRTLTAADVGPVDVICGGSPCQDMSTAGKQVGITGAKSGLWFEYLRLVRELRPGVVVIENVPPLYRNLAWRRQVQEPLEALGYRVIWTLCKASDVGAPHRRERTFALAVLPGVSVPMVRAPRLATVLDGEAWPTPAAMIPQDGEGVATFEARRQMLKAKHGNGNGCGTPLSIAVQPWPTPTRQFDMQTNGPNGNAGEYLLGAALWPTPRAEDSESTGAHRGVPDTLTSAARLWTTPTARDGNGAGTGPAAEGADALSTQACWASPAARDYRSGKGRADNGHTPQLPEQVAGVLNPAWVEPLCGLPIGWTEAEGDPMAINFAPRWVVGRGQPQHDWEPPRTLPPKTGKDRRKRLMALGNIVVPQQAMLALARLSATANDTTRCAFGGAQLVMI